MSQLTDNEVLTEFIGGKHRNMIGPLSGEEYTEVKLPGSDRYLIARYDRDYQWLMPVWYKFKELKFTTGTDIEKYEEHCIDVAGAILNKGCAEACKLLANAIRWYNTVKQ